MRIVSLCPSLTDLVFELGRGSDLVGVTGFCVRPEEGVAGITKIGGTKNPRITHIRALKPDVVLMNAEENRREDHDELIGHKIRTCTTMPRAPEDVPRMIRDVAQSIGAFQAGNQLADRIQSQVDSARETAKARSPVRFLALVWNDPPMVAGPDTYLSKVVALAGGQNVAGEIADPGGDRYPTLTPETLRRADPERVLLPSEPFPFEDKHAEALASASGIDRARFRLADGMLLTWHGPLTPRGIEHAGSLLRD